MIVPPSVTIYEISRLPPVKRGSPPVQVSLKHSPSRRAGTVSSHLLTADPPTGSGRRLPANRQPPRNCAAARRNVWARLHGGGALTELLGQD